MLLLVPLLVSTIVIVTLLTIDQILTNTWPTTITIIVKYFIPLLLIAFNYYFVPWMLYRIVQYESHQRKTEKEDSFMGKNISFMILNTLIIPLIICTILASFDGHLYYESPDIPKLAKYIPMTFNFTSLMSDRAG
jgi:heme/copper-type cytochrome/quinol oxidase subunit 2